MRYEAAVLAVPLLAGCAHLEAPPRRAQALGPARLTGIVLEIIPRLVLEDLSWEFALLVETPDGGLVTVYAGEERPEIRVGDHVRVDGQWLPDGVVDGEASLLARTPGA